MFYGPKWELKNVGVTYVVNKNDFLIKFFK